MLRLITIVFLICLKISVFGQTNQELTYDDIKNKQFLNTINLNKMKIGDTVEFKKNKRLNFRNWSTKFKKNGKIIEIDVISDYSGKHFFRKKYISGMWILENQILFLKWSKTSYCLEFVKKDEKSIFFQLKTIATEKK